MTSAAHDRLAAVAPNAHTAMSLSQTSTLSDDRSPETSSITSSGGFAVPPPPPPPPVATESRAPTHHDDKTSFSQQHSSQLLSTDERFSQSDPRSAEGSQASNATSSFDRVFTPTPSDDGTTPNELHRPAQDSQLLQLSAIAATQDRMETDGSDMVAGSRKRMADGEVKSPGKGHSRTTSTLSMASTTSTIGDVSLAPIVSAACLGSDKTSCRMSFGRGYLTPW